jgi:hypothetical protein
MHKLTNLRSLELRDFSSDDEDVNYFKNLRKLEKLSMNTYSSIESDAFINIEKLERLSCLELNFWTWNTVELKSEPFKRLQNLRELSIYTFGRMYIDSNFLHNFPNLICLKLESISDFELSASTFSMQHNLEKLEMIRCDFLATLPDHFFANLSNLKELYLHGGRLGFLANAQAFNGLENLSQFKFASLSSSFDLRRINLDGILNRMPKLQRLAFNSNIRKSIGDIICTMKTQFFPNLKLIEYI